ncbi:MAG TPA: CHASE3 domain-containing protein, partial [Polyangiales bacterium]|nr:CHASE3 domain-containing protein [Polyangiales bacterium]
MTIARLRSPSWLFALSAVIVLGLFSYVNGRIYLEHQAAVRDTLSSREALASTLSLLKDAETGGRGFLLTGDERFLEPYEAARPKLRKELAALARLGQTDPSQRAAAERVARLAEQKLAVLNDLIARRRADRLAVRDAVPMLKQGKAIMDAIRVEIARMFARADLRLFERDQATDNATLRLQVALGAAVGGGVLLALAGLSAASRDAERARSANQQLARDMMAREQAELQLRDQTRLLESVLTNIGDAVIVVDSDRRVVMLNPAAARVAPFSVGAELSVAWSKQVQTFLADGETLFPPERGPLTLALQGQASDAVEMIIRVTSGELRSFSVTTRPMLSGGATVAAVAVFHDTTDLKRAVKDLLENEQRYRVLSEASFEGVAITRDGLILDTNANFAGWLGYSASELIGTPGIALFVPEEQARVRELSLSHDVSYESTMRRRDGSKLAVEVRGRYATFRNETVRIAVIRDVTEKKAREAKLLEQSEQLRALALRDELTGLHNRRGFMEIAEHQLKAAMRNREPCAVFFADLNGMKAINDELGHEMGDRAIRATGSMLTEVFRSSDVVARLGG